MARELGESEHAIRVSPRDTQSHLHHPCHRVAEQCHSQSDQKTQGIPDGRLGQKGALPGHPGSIEKVEHADSRLENSAESIYDFVRRPHRPIHLTRGSYTEKFTASEGQLGSHYDIYCTKDEWTLMETCARSRKRTYRPTADATTET